MKNSDSAESPRHLRRMKKLAPEIGLCIRYKLYEIAPRNRSHRQFSQFELAPGIKKHAITQQTIANASCRHQAVAPMSAA